MRPCVASAFGTPSDAHEGAPTRAMLFSSELEAFSIRTPTVRPGAVVAAVERYERRRGGVAAAGDRG